MDESAAARVITELTLGHLAPRCLHVIAEFGVADALGDEPASAGELAARTGINADALGRALRLLAAHGVFAHGAEGYAHTPASRLLRSDHPQSLRAYARMIGMPAIWNGVTNLADATRTGRPATDSASLFAYFADHPEEASLFNQAMAGKSASVVPAVVEAYDFGQFSRIADIGGGRAHLLRAILDHAPGSSGILFELPHVVADAGEVASSRLSLVAGDFFADPLPVADCYILMEVIHDWGDSEATAILAAVRRAAPRQARILIVETLVSEEPGPQWGNVLDLVMLAVTAGRERTPSEYAALLAAAGLRLERVVPTHSAYSIVEAIVA